LIPPARRTRAFDARHGRAQTRNGRGRLTEVDVLNGELRSLEEGSVTEVDGDRPRG